jgi:hypothetical protein
MENCILLSRNEAMSLIVYYATSFINECLEKFIKNVLHTILFLRPNKQMKQATFLLNVNLIV